MRLPLVAGFVTTLLAATTVSAHPTPRDHDAYDYFALHLDPSVPPERVAQALNARHEGQIGKLADHHTFSVPKGQGLSVDTTLDGLRKRRRRRSVSGNAASDLDTRSAGDALHAIKWSQRLTLKPRMQKRPPPPLPSTPDQLAKRSRVKQNSAAVTRAKSVASTLSIKDPIFLEQWHLYNTYEVGHDLNVTGLWLEGITGNGTISAIVDDGLDLYSNDLKDNYYAEGSYDFNDKSSEPKPRLFDDKHGTRCAGEVAAVRNDVCGVGVAYDSKVAGIRILSKPVTDEDEALAINYGYEKTDIYSCSWGPVDDGKTMDAPGILIQRAMVEGVQHGRDGKGSIFVFAAGNGAASGDNCNFDGYTNSIYSITVGAVDTDDNHPYYSESCSAQLVVTYSSGGSGGIQTTDVGVDTCSTRHGGTSAAGPLVVGVVALAVSVRPELTWRDIQHLIVQTAIPVHEDDDDSDWQVTSIGKKFSHDFGYGKVDAYTLVQLAKEWELVKPQAWIHSPWQLVHHAIPQGDQGLASSYEITEEMLKKNNLERVEHVTVTMNVNHTRRGDLSVELRSPDGIVSHLSTARKYDEEPRGYVDWTFMSVAHWGESGKGKWTVIVKDTAVNEHKGTFVDWQLTLWGEAIDGDKQELHPLPNEHDHDHETEIASHVATTEVAPGPTKAPGGNPSDHIDRPVNAKPTGTTPGGEVSPSSTSTTEPTSTATPSAASESFLPSIFPTFGASKRTQMWIYGSLALILIFCCTLGIYFYIQRRRRLRNNPRDDYEFEMIEDDGAGHHLGGGHAGSRKPRRRGGELYDAFAGESDEELLSSEGENEKESNSDEPYRDEASGSDGVRDDYNEKERRRSRDGLSDET